MRKLNRAIGPVSAIFLFTGLCCLLVLHVTGDEVLGIPWMHLTLDIICVTMIAGPLVHLVRLK